jgi:hypothetical protein
LKRVTIGVKACTDILALLISVAWSDERLDDGEKEGVRAAAGLLNLPREVRALVDLLMEKPKPLDEIRFEGCSDRDKAFGFVAASWMARVDGELDPKELELLKRVGESMGLPEARRAELSALTEELEPAPAAGQGKWSEHIAYLFKTVLPRLESAPAAELEEGFEIVVE